MSERKDEKWLDEQLQRAVNGAMPTFDAEGWKQKYAKEYETLLARGEQAVGWGLPHHDHQDAKNRWGRPHPTMRILRGPFAKLAIAAAVVATAGILLVGRLEPGPRPPAVTVDSASPAQMVSMISLSAAFRQGGMEGLDRQCDRALERLGPRPNSVSMQDLLKDINGKG
jgi:hypothetical protein